VTGTATSIVLIDDEKGIWENAAVEKVMGGSYAPLKLLRVHLRVNEKFLSVAATPVRFKRRASVTATMLLAEAMPVRFVVSAVMPFNPVTVVCTPALVKTTAETMIVPADSRLVIELIVKVKGELVKRYTGVKPESSSSPY
jgi:hypothetical protein